MWERGCSLPLRRSSPSHTVIRAEGPSPEKPTPSDWSVGNSVEESFFISDCSGRAHRPGGGTNPAEVVLGGM